MVNIMNIIVWGKQLVRTHQACICIPTSEQRFSLSEACIFSFVTSLLREENLQILILLEKATFLKQVEAPTPPFLSELLCFFEEKKLFHILAFCIYTQRTEHASVTQFGDRITWTYFTNHMVNVYCPIGPMDEPNFPVKPVFVECLDVNYTSWPI